MADQQTVVEEGVRIQRWTRLDSPAEGWWPWGLLPLLGLLLLLLFALLYFAEAEVEDDVATQAKTRLDAAGYSWAEVSANGQEVVVRGTAPAPVDTDTIAALAKTTECATWAGRLSCPTSVRVDVQVAAPPPPPPAPPPLPPLRPHDFSFERAQGVVVLSGEVPTEADRRQLVDAAIAAFGKVDDQLKVTNARPTASYGKAYTTALDLLKLLVTGKAEWLGGLFGASGVIMDGKEAEVDALLSAFGGPTRGKISLLREQEANVCDRDFAARLKRTKIRFATSSANIRPESMSLLRELAGIAKRCPVTLQIEGHTDSTGSEVFNDTLSRDRADSVRKVLEGMQIEADRLVAVGYGQHRPIGDNRTASGRAQNRRIEIKIRR